MNENPVELAQAVAAFYRTLITEDLPDWTATMLTQGYMGIIITQGNVPIPLPDSFIAAGGKYGETDQS